MQHYSHLATATNILWKLIEANGHDPEVLYRDVGIDPDLLNKPGARVPYTLVNSLWAKATEIIDDPCFGLKANNYWHPSYFHALVFSEKPKFFKILPTVVLLTFMSIVSSASAIF